MEEKLLEILDTAIKIGLGALISGGVTYLITTLNHNNDKTKWLREAKLKAFSNLSKELLSFGFESETFEDEYKFTAIASNAILLIEDQELITRIQQFIKDLVNFNKHEYSKILNKPDKTLVSLADGVVIKKNAVEIGYYLMSFQEEAYSIVEDLNNNLKK